jgi:hypothetical protein
VKKQRVRGVNRTCRRCNKQFLPYRRYQDRCRKCIRSETAMTKHRKARSVSFCNECTFACRSACFRCGNPACTDKACSKRMSYLKYGTRRICTTCQEELGRMKTKVTYEDCSIYVEGMEMVCPLCKTTVKSGEHHTCKRPTLEVKVRREAGAGA